MSMLTTVSPSTTTQMTTNIHYHTQLQAVWKSDYVYDVTLFLSEKRILEVLDGM